MSYFLRKKQPRELPKSVSQKGNGPMYGIAAPFYMNQGKLNAGSMNNSAGRESSQGSSRLPYLF